jgi:hypothetical protein
VWTQGGFLWGCQNWNWQITDQWQDQRLRRRVGPDTRKSLMGGYISRKNHNIVQDAFHFSVVACFRCVHFSFQWPWSSHTVWIWGKHYVDGFTFYRHYSLLECDIKLCVIQQISTNILEELNYQTWFSWHFMYKVCLVCRIRTEICHCIWNVTFLCL